MSMRTALMEMANNQLDEVKSVNEGFSDSQLAQLKKQYEPLRNKKISLAHNDKLNALINRFSSDKDALGKIYKADIPFVSQTAMLALMMKHNYKAADLNKLMEMANNQLDEASAKFKKAAKDSTLVHRKGMYDVKYAKSRKGPISVKSFDSLDDAKNFLSDKKKEGFNGMVTKDGKPVKESVERAAWVPESIADEQVEAFMEATVAAVAEGEDTFVFEGKSYKAKTKKEDKLDPVGKEDDDVDNDGDVDSSDKYLKKRRAAIKKSMDEEKIDEISRDKQDASYTDRYATGGKDTAAMQKRRKAAIQKAADRFKKTGSYTGKKESVEEAEKKGLWYNIHKKRKEGRPMRKPGSKGAPTAQDFKDAQKTSKKESVEESTAQHSKDAATSDTFQKQMGGGRSPREKEFVDMHNLEVALDVNKIHDDNKANIEKALKQTPARMGDNLKNGDTSFVSPLKADIIDGITKALQQMKTNN